VQKKTGSTKAVEILDWQQSLKKNTFNV